MTQEALARCTRVTVPTLCRLEGGVYYPNWRTIRRIATGLRITLAELMTAVEACES
jgi:transcriptional regulator with XRE-family HTH domain